MVLVRVWSSLYNRLEEDESMVRRFVLVARSEDGLHVRVEVHTGRNGYSGKAGELTMTKDDWQAFHVMLIAGQNKYGHLLSAEVAVECDESLL